MLDSVFGILEYEDAWSCWVGKLALDFFGNPVELDVYLQQRYDEPEHDIYESQYETFKRFMEQWPALQKPLVERLIRYYNEEERFSYGPDDKEELLKWWPELQTVDDMLQQITLETMVIKSDSLMQAVYDGKRCLCLLFSH